MNTQTKIFIVTIFALMTFKTQAQDDSSGRREAFEACVIETGVSKAERDSRPSDEDRQKLSACMEAKGFTKPERGEGRGGQNSAFHEAAKACAEENNIAKPERGSQGSEEDRAKMKACLEGKGYSRPEGSSRQ